MAPRFSQLQKSRTGGNVLQCEIVQEQAAALGRLGRSLEAALRGLAAHDAIQSSRLNDDASQPSRKEARTQLLEAAGYALWCFIVQREACGLRDQGTVIREYGVPAEVRNRMGLFPNSPARRNR
jgi:hypothetical protein